MISNKPDSRKISYLVLALLEVAEHCVAEAVVHGLRDERGGEVSRAHAGERAPQRAGVVRGHSAEVGVELGTPLVGGLQTVDLRIKFRVLFCSSSPIKNLYLHVFPLP